VVSGHHTLVISSVKPLYNGKFILKIIPKVISKVQYFSQMYKFIHYEESRNSLTKNILYLVHHVKIINIRNYRKALNLNDKVKVINRCDQWWEKLLGCGRGEGCWAYPDNEHSLKKT
jgi:hypothetical protein